MNFLDEIYQTYLTLDGWLKSQEAESPPVAAIPWLRMSELNDYAFFVLLFGQLEDCINQEYEQSIGPWEEAAFEHRINCLFGKSSAQAEIIMEYYDLRCDVAHGYAEGGQMGEHIHVPEVNNKILTIIAQYDT